MLGPRRSSGHASYQAMQEGAVGGAITVAQLLLPLRRRGAWRRRSFLSVSAFSRVRPRRRRSRSSGEADQNGLSRVRPWRARQRSPGNSNSPPAVGWHDIKIP